MLVSVDEADSVLMDRWTILLDAHETNSAENSVVDMEPPKVPVQHLRQSRSLLTQACGAVGFSFLWWGRVEGVCCGI